ncbi:MAG TPA: hypothetical protein VKR58_12600 [Aquella sp.]|nr:hypothetical protein [Aquella sp.]
MKKFTLRGYLFSILVLFLCMNVAQAVKANDQMFKCTVPSSDGTETNYIIHWLASGDKVYSTFGIAKEPNIDINGNLVGLGNLGNNDPKNFWSIIQNKGCCGKVSWKIQLMANGSYVIDATNVKCNAIMFDQQLAIAVARFYTNSETDYSLKYMIKDNPIKMKSTDELEIGSSDACSEEITEKTGLVGKKRCCSKNMCALL